MGKGKKNQFLLYLFYYPVNDRQLPFLLPTYSYLVDRLSTLYSRS